MMNRRFNNKRKKAFFFAPFIIAMLFGLGALVMVLWNTILPDLFGVKELGYWQALGLLVLCKILFGGFGPGRRGKGCGHHNRRHAFMREKLAGMSQEERIKFREEWKKRWH